MPSERLPRVLSATSRVLGAETTSGQRAGFAAILAVGGLLRLAFLLPLWHMERLAESIDAHAAYVPLARNLYQGYVDHDSPLFALGLFRTPGYPVFLAALFATVRSEVGIVAIQALLGLGVIVLTFRLAASIWDADAGLCAAALVALDLASIAWGGYLQPETLFALLFVAAMAAWLSGVKRASLRMMAASGLLLGLSSLVRPVSFYLIPLLVVAAWLLYRSPIRERLVLVGALAAAFAVSAGPWVVRNEVVASLPAMSSADSRNLVINNAAGALVESEGVSLAQADAQLLARVRSSLPTHPSAGAVAAAERSVAVDVIAHHPGGFAISELKGVGRILFGTARETTLHRLGRGNPDAVPKPAQMAVLGAGLLMLGLTYVGLVVGTTDLFRTRRWPELVAVFIPVLYSVMVTAGPVANGRFRVPFMPLLAVVAGRGLVLARDKLWSQRECSATRRNPLRHASPK